MKLTLIDGCSVSDLKIDNNSIRKMSKSDQNSVLDIVIDKLRNKQEPLIILEALIEQLGDWHSDETECEQCGDVVETWTLDLDN